MADSILDTERRHVRRAQEMILRQEQRVARLHRIGDSRTAGLAAKVLNELRQSLKLGQERIAYLERQSQRPVGRAVPDED